MKLSHVIVSPKTLGDYQLLVNVTEWKEYDTATARYTEKTLGYVYTVMISTEDMTEMINIKIKGDKQMSKPRIPKPVKFEGLELNLSVQTVKSGGFSRQNYIVSGKATKIVGLKAEA